ncbi:PilZ domain-containing protein [Beijerinckia sp. L45]|uniref:PilZ domain-containing protein n=1 Tax=Beijerinckia sp. L45 TaxID=1641855 RepID=UPI00210F93B9|nr:PilZ domain-containing protein [Beijerinckia sp. L45]
MTELRAAERGRSLLKAKIVFNNRMSSIDCIVKNISTGGAKIAVASTLSIPSEFDLEIPQRGKTYRVQMRWRDTDHMGVEFMDAVESKPPSGSADYEKLEVENARLRATIQALTKRLTDLGQDLSGAL